MSNDVFESGPRAGGRGVEVRAGLLLRVEHAVGNLSANTSLTEMQYTIYKSLEPNDALTELEGTGTKDGYVDYRLRVAASR